MCSDPHLQQETLFHREQCALGLNTENTVSLIFTLFLNILTIRSDRQTDRCMDERMDRQTDI